ncbi:YidH family protein [Olivibacter sp. XZL3]|uniref:YidH family protein n=1 Tax=Olivibacter sp. XZL3 TaxID=1735116 RepID=UPI001065C7B6|nr:DUF202 domain-containing protein [Olivibacter sp. XZL3]
MEKDKKPVPNDHLANERTFLAWVRTCIATIGLGFVVVKFSLFIRQLSSVIDIGTSFPHHRYSDSIGMALVASGMTMAVFAYYRFKKTQEQLLANNFRPSWRTFLGITIAIIVLGVVLVWYLLQSTR